MSLNSNKTTFSVFKLAMMSVIAIDSLKNLTSNAQYGASLIFYYLAALLLFFIPSALICAELATSVPKPGGAYAWVREAFGNFPAFMTAWMQWLIAITWAPTILVFSVVTLMYLISPDLAENKLFILCALLILFWSTVFLITRGVKLFGFVISSSAIIGVILPMLAIAILGLVWVVTGNPMQVKFDLATTNVNLVSSEHLRLFIPLLYSLMGMEIIGAHAANVENPSRKYPLAIFLAATLIALTTIPASFAIAIVIPHDLINLTTGFVMTANHFLQAFHIAYLLPCFVIMIVIGSYGSFYNWLLTVSRYLLTAAEDGSLPNLLRITNKQDMPTNLLCLQGIIFSILASFIILMPSVESAFWLLSVSCAQFALLYYMILFSAAIYLRFKYPNLPRPFKVGRSPLLILVLGGIAIVTCTIVFALGFIPPDESSPVAQNHYFVYLSSVMLMGLALGAGIYGWTKRNRPVVQDVITATTDNSFLKST